jgi:hypothetical protein
VNPLRVLGRDRRRRLCLCGASGREVWWVDRLVVFWKRGGVWWRDDAPGLGRLCGYCGVPTRVLLENGVAVRKRGPSR